MLKCKKVDERSWVMNITPELFREVVDAAMSAGYRNGLERGSSITIDLSLANLMITSGGQVRGSGTTPENKFYTIVEFGGVKFTALTHEQVVLPKTPEMSIERRNEIAHKVLLYWAFKEGRQIGESTPREIGNIAKVTEIPFEEVAVFMQDLFGTLMKEVFSAHGMRFKVNKMKAEGKVKDS